MSEKKDKAQFKVNVDIIERIDKLEKAVFDILTILTGEFAGESDVLKRLTGHINKICSNSPAPVSDGESLWEVGSLGTVFLDADIVGDVNKFMVPAFRTLIAREKLCDEMYRWIKECRHLHIRGSMGWVQRNTLIAEYEETEK